MKTQFQDSLSFLQDGGEAAALLRAMASKNSPLGAPESWPERLKGAIRSMLDSPVARSIFVGLQYIHLYNDAYIPSSMPTCSLLDLYW